MWKKFLCFRINQSKMSDMKTRENLLMGIKGKAWVSTESKDVLLVWRVSLNGF